MLKSLFKPFVPVREPPFILPELRRMDQRAVERACARLFSTEDGKIVLNHLQALAFMRVYGPDATDVQIRYAEGQRALVGQLLRLITAGRQG